MELSEENLEYITFVAKEYCHLPEFNDEYSRLNASTHAKSIFKARYETLNDTFQKAYQEYSQNEKIQSTINIYQLDSNKLWLLFLFITDFTESCFYEDTIIEEFSITEFELISTLSSIIEFPSIHTLYPNFTFSPILQLGDIKTFLSE